MYVCLLAMPITSVNGETKKPFDAFPLSMHRLCMHAMPLTIAGMVPFPVVN